MPEDCPDCREAFEALRKWLEEQETGDDEAA